MVYIWGLINSAHEAILIALYLFALYRRLVACDCIECIVPVVFPMGIAWPWTRRPCLVLIGLCLAGESAVLT